MGNIQKMVRVEVIGNQILLQDFIDTVEARLPKQWYTVLPVLHAKGQKGKANGDAVWMEKNFVCLMFINSVEAIAEIERICDSIKAQNTANALTMFTSRVLSVVDE